MPRFNAGRATMAMNSSNLQSRPDRPNKPDARHSFARSAPATAAVLRGALGLCLPAMVVFGSWAVAGRWMYRSLTERGAFLVWALLFVVLGGAIYHRLLVRSKGLAWFYGVFATAFLLYALGWSLSWFPLKNTTGELLGTFVGPALMGLVFLAAFGSWRDAFNVLASLIVAHYLGYFIGGILYIGLPGIAGKVLWGLAYGLGFGGGIGLALHLVQQAEPERSLKSSSNASRS